jgi:hypothetical protein
MASVSKTLPRFSEIRASSPFLIRYIRNWKIVSSLSGVRIVENCSLSFIPNEATIFASSAREWRADENDGVMKKVREKNNEMLREYDFSQGVRGKYARRYARGSNVVVLEPDVAKVFPNAEAVNASAKPGGDYPSTEIARAKIEDRRRPARAKASTWKARKGRLRYGAPRVAYQLYRLGLCVSYGVAGFFSKSDRNAS